MKLLALNEQLHDCCRFPLAFADLHTGVLSRLHTSQHSISQILCSAAEVTGHASQPERGLGRSTVQCQLNVSFTEESMVHNGRAPLPSQNTRPVLVKLAFLSLLTDQATTFTPVTSRVTNRKNWKRSMGFLF